MGPPGSGGFVILVLPVCMSVCMCLCAGVHASVHLCVDARRQLQMPFLQCCPSRLKQALSLNEELTHLARQAGQRAPGSPLSLPPHHSDR